MSRDGGFAVMDVSTSIHEDPKFRRLARRHPELAAPAFLAYLATAAESWRSGERIRVEDAWPSLIPFDRAVVAALRRFDLLDRDGMVAPATWDRWFGPARERRDLSREKWRRANDRRKGKEEALEHHGSRCGICGDEIDLALRYPDPRCFTVDHVIPISAGGSDVPENRQPSHLSCNLAKGNRPGGHSGYHGGTGVVNPPDTTATVPSVPSVPSVGLTRSSSSQGARALGLVDPVGRTA